MVKRINNLQSIQVFRVVSDVLNVTLAAKELGISQSAVSYHIKKLETDLATRLFDRSARGLQLTQIGVMLLSHVEAGLNEIQSGISRIVDDNQSVKIAILPMFASRWLSSRLSQFLDTNPKLQLSLKSHNNTYATMKSPESYANFGIHWGTGDWENVDAIKLWPEQLTVVCSPSYLHEHPIQRPSDIMGCTILHVDDNRMWREWLNNHEIDIDNIDNELMLEDRHFQLSSTINGLGVSLFAHWAVEDEIQSGTLVNPFNQNFETDFAYYLVVPKNSILTKEAKKFHDWLSKNDKKQ